MRIAISSGHGADVPGAEGLIVEVEEARRVVNMVALYLNDCVTFHDDTSQSQSENLNTIVEWHNSQKRDLDVSVHFNAYEPTDKAMGTEVLFLTADERAQDVVDAITSVGFTNRGIKQRTDLAFLNGTDEPAILIEVCFVDSTEDVGIYHEYFDEICRLIAAALEEEAIS